jgi:hypothetical protein
VPARHGFCPYQRLPFVFRRFRRNGNWPENCFDERAGRDAQGVERAGLAISNGG